METIERHMCKTFKIPFRMHAYGLMMENQEQVINNQVQTCKQMN